jgi:hypothetical protein
MARCCSQWQQLFPADSRKVSFEHGGRTLAEADAMGARAESGLRKVVEKIVSPVHTSPALALGGAGATSDVSNLEHAACGEVVLPCSGVNHPIAYGESELYLEALAVSSRHFPSQYLMPTTASQLDELPPAEVVGRFFTIVFSVYMPCQQDACPLLRHVASLGDEPTWLDSEAELDEEDTQCAIRELVMLEIDAC